MSALELPPQTEPPAVEDETAADADLRDLVGEIEWKLGRNSHQVTVDRWAGWAQLVVTTPQGFTYDMPVVQRAQ